MFLFNQTAQEQRPFPPNESEPANSQLIINAIDATPQNVAPLDHTNSYVTVDILIRYLESIGYTVDYRQNIPLNDDKMWASYFVEEVDKLNIRLPEFATFEVDLADKTIDRSRDAANLHFYICSGEEPAAAGENHIRLQLYKPWKTAVSKKINESVGSLLNARMFLEQFSLNAVRLYFAQHHYRKQWQHDMIVLERAARNAEKLNTALAAKSVDSTEQILNSKPAERRFFTALGNDLNTFGATAALLNLADDILFKAPSGYNVQTAQETLAELAQILGLKVNNKNAS